MDDQELSLDEYTCRYFKVYEILRLEELVQWGEDSPLTSAPYVSCCWLSPSSEGFSPGTPVSLTFEKPTFPNSNSKWLSFFLSIIVDKCLPLLCIPLFTLNQQIWQHIASDKLR